MIRILTTLFFLTICCCAASAQVVGDDCLCDQSWGTALTQEEEDYRQIVLETVSTLSCELPYSRELSENPIGLLRAFMENPHGRKVAFEEFLYGFEQILLQGEKSGYLDKACAEGLRTIKAHLEKLAEEAE